VCLLRGTDCIFIYRQFNIQQFYVLPTQCIYVFCVDLRTSSDYFHIYICIGFKTSFYVVRHLDSTASSYIPIGLRLGFFRSWPSLYLPSSFSWLFPYTALINLFFEPRPIVFTARYVQTLRLMCSGDALDDWMYQFDFTGQSCRPGMPLPLFISTRCSHVVSSAWKIKLVAGRRYRESQVRQDCALRTALWAFICT